MVLTANVAILARFKQLYRIFFNNIPRHTHKTQQESQKYFYLALYFSSLILCYLCSVQIFAHKSREKQEAILSHMLCRMSVQQRPLCTNGTKGQRRLRLSRGNQYFGRSSYLSPAIPIGGNAILTLGIGQTGRTFPAGEIRLCDERGALVFQKNG